MFKIFRQLTMPVLISLFASSAYGRPTETADFDYSLSKAADRFRSSCIPTTSGGQVTYHLFEVKIYENSLHVMQLQSTDPKCSDFSQVTIVLRAVADFQQKLSINGIIYARFEPKNILFHLTSAQGEKLYNQRRACGLEGWKANETRDVLADGSSDKNCVGNLAGLFGLNDIFKIEGDYLKIGLKSAPGVGITQDSFPSRVSDEFKLKRISRQ
jgi:hypothetical protein